MNMHHYLRAAENPRTASNSLETALIAIGAGILFVTMGFLLATNYRGAARWFINSADASLDDISWISRPLRRFNISVFHGGDEERFHHHKTHVMPKILGVGFMAAGGASLLAGLVGLITA